MQQGHTVWRTAEVKLCRSEDCDQDLGWSHADFQHNGGEASRPCVQYALSDLDVKCCPYQAAYTVELSTPGYIELARQSFSCGTGAVSSQAAQRPVYAVSRGDYPTPTPLNRTPFIPWRDTSKRKRYEQIVVSYSIVSALVYNGIKSR